MLQIVENRRLFVHVDDIMGHPSNNIVQQFLNYKVGHPINPRDWGYACARDIQKWARMKGIEIPCNGTKINTEVRWLNYRIKDAIIQGLPGFKIIEVEGLGIGVNFKWERLK